MSLSPSPTPNDDDLPTNVLDEREPIVSNLKQLHPNDVKIKVSDGEVWANKALLSVSSEYFSAMLDEEKFKEGREGVGSLEKYSKDVVSKLIHYFYSGEMSCKELSLSSLLHLEDLLRLVLLLPQSTKIQEFTHRKISLKKFSIQECLLGLVTADDLDLATTGDHLLEFINNNLGSVALKESRNLRGLFITGNPAPMMRFSLIYEYIKRQDDETQKKILKSLDPSSYNKPELLDLVRKNFSKVENSEGVIHLYKDHIRCSRYGRKGHVVFYPQHRSKLE